MDDKYIIEVVGAIIKDGDRYLVGQRAADKARQKSAAQAKPKNGIMRGMKGRAKSALALTLAIVSGMAALSKTIPALGT